MRLQFESPRWAIESCLYRLVVSNQLFIRHGPFECKRISWSRFSQFFFLSFSSLFYLAFFRHGSMNREGSEIRIASFRICMGSRGINNILPNTSMKHRLEMLSMHYACFLPKHLCATVSLLNSFREIHIYSSNILVVTRLHD